MKLQPSKPLNSRFVRRVEGMVFLSVTVVKRMLNFFPHRFSWFVSLSVQKVAELPMSRRAYDVTLL